MDVERDQYLRKIILSASEFTVRFLLIDRLPHQTNTYTESLVMG